MSWLLPFVRELRRRRVFRMTAIYVVAAWVAVQVAGAALPGLEIPDVAIRYVWLAALLGFPLVLAFSWRYDVTSQGIVRTPPADPDARVDLSLRSLDYVILGFLGVLAAGVAYQLTVQFSRTRSADAGQTAGLEIRPNAIAVLPLDNQSGDPDQVYFVEGMQDALIAGLSMISGLAVTSRTSTLQFKSGTTPVRQIAAQLGVARVIEGSVYRVADRVRISLQLIDAQHDVHLWAKDYERQFDDVLRMQREVAQDIAREVQVGLTPAESTRFAVVSEVDPKAHDAYLLGRFHSRRYTPQDLRLAVQYFQLAAEIDPDYALAIVGLASTSAQLIVMGAVAPREQGPKWQAAVERAVLLDPELAEAQNALAVFMTWYGWDWAKAEVAFVRSIELNPSYAGSRVFYSHFLTAMGRADEAAVQIERALQLDPLNSFYQAMYGVQLLMARQTDAALDQFRQTFDSDPGLGFGHIPYMAVLNGLGMQDDALAEALIHLQQIGDVEAIGVIETGYDDAGFPGAMRSFAELLEHRSKTTFVKPMTLVTAYDYGGDIESAFRWLIEAYDVRDHDMVYLNVLPFSDQLRSDPRFAEFLNRMGIPH